MDAGIRLVLQSRNQSRRWHSSISADRFIVISRQLMENAESIGWTIALFYFVIDQRTETRSNWTNAIIISRVYTAGTFIISINKESKRLTPEKKNESFGDCVIHEGRVMESATRRVARRERIKKEKKNISGGLSKKKKNVLRVTWIKVTLSSQKKKRSLNSKRREEEGTLLFGRHISRRVTREFPARFPKP